MPPRWRKRRDHIEERHRCTLALLREFIARHGWDALNKDTMVSHVRLYGWVMHRRMAYRNDTIADWLVPACEAIPGWSWDPFYDAYRRNLDNVRRYAKQDGWDALARTKPVVDGVRLDRWVNHRRDEYRSGEIERWLIPALEALPGWTWHPRTALQERNVRDLREHVERNGWPSFHAHTISRRGSLIGNWVTSVRMRYRDGELETWIAQEVESIPGWSWEPLRDLQQENVELLAGFVAMHGWDAATRAIVVDGVRLGEWISNCRGRYRRGILSSETIAGLDAIPGWSWRGKPGPRIRPKGTSR